MIKENPVLGVGLGNWKIAVLEQENKVNKGFVYSYKAHNDFLENTAETGIIGGLLYISIYVMLGIAFLLAFFHRRKSEALYKYLFLAVTGLIFYSFDAVFNFPHDRPEMVILFALYVAIGVSSSYYLNRVVSATTETSDQESEISRNSNRSEAILSGDSADNFSHLKHDVKPWIFNSIGSLIVLVMLAMSYLFFINFESSKLQRVVYQEIMSGKLKSPSSMFVGSFPVIPNVSIWGESISVLVARYLINDSKNREAIEVLLPEKLNPYDARREFFLAMAYNNLKETDSALIYSKKAYELKPKYFRNLHLMMTLMEEKKLDNEIPEIFYTYLEDEKNEKNAWIYATSFYSKTNEIDKAWELIQEGMKYLPNDSLMLQQHRYLHHRKFVEPNRELFNRAMNAYNSSNHSAALQLFNEYIGIVPDDSNALRLRAFTMYFLKDYTNSLEEIAKYFDKFGKEGSMVNLRGVCFREIGELDKACKDFEEAMKMGVDAGKTNFDRFCRGRS
jgi:putative inorganic carbon (hco3(-)) transporter